MGGELLSEDAPPSFKTYTEQFYEALPFHMAIGMSYQEYWFGEPTLPKYYRKAYKLKDERENYSAWLHGCYIYDALCAVSPVLNAFAKRGTTPMPYHKQPYGGAQQPIPKQQDAEAKVGAAKFEAYVAQLNKKIKTEGGGKGAHD